MMSRQSQAEAEIRAIRALARAEGRPLRPEEQDRVSELLESGITIDFFTLTDLLISTLWQRDFYYAQWVGAARELERLRGELEQLKEEEER